MKKNLLLLGAALLMTASAMAQTFTRVYPKPTAPQMDKSWTVGDARYFGTVEEDAEEIYLWNVEAGGFYTHYYYLPDAGRADHYWATRATVNDSVGAKVLISRINPFAENTYGAEDETNWTLHEGLDGNPIDNSFTWLLKSYNANEHFADQPWYPTAASVWNNIYTDAACTQEWHTFRHFYFTQNADGYLQIAPNNYANNPVDGYVDWSGRYLGVRGNEVDGDKFAYLLDRETEGAIGADEAFYSTWAIVTQDAYEEYVAQNPGAMIALRLAANALKKAVEDAEAKYEIPASYFAAQYAAYNDTDATVESLNEAKAGIADIVVAWNAGHATPENPADFSEKIVDRTFDGGADIKFDPAWQGTGWGAGGTRSHCAERYKMTFDTYQDITGLDEGVYMVVVDGFARINDNHESDWTAWKAGELPNAKLYVGCESFGEFESPMKPASAGATTEQFTTAATTTHVEDGVNWYAPNSMLAFTDFLAYYAEKNERPYGSKAFGALAAGETLRVGARNKVDTEWVIVDNFELWYLGKTDGAYRVWAQTLLELWPNFNWDDEEIYYGKPEKDYYDAMKAKLTSTTATAQDIIEAAQKMSLVEDTVKQSIAAYGDYVKEILWEEWLADNKLDQTTDEFAMLEDYMTGYAVGPSDTYPHGNVAYILDINSGVHEGTLSVEEVKAEIEFVKEMKAAALQAGLVKGANFTSLIVNSDFDQTPAGKGWTQTHTGNMNLRGGLSSNYCAEVWNGTFDIYQDIENSSLKEGLYKVNVRAFQRTGGNASAWSDWCAGTAVVTTEVYLNEFATPVQNLQSVQYKEQMGNHRTEATHTVDGVTVYTLDDMNGASTAFSLPDDYSTDNYMNYDPANMLKGEAVLANFKQTVYGLITEQGKLRLGIRCQTPGKDGDYWSLWDKFELYYMGFDVEAIQFVMNDYSKRGDAITITEVGTDDWDAYDGVRASLANVITAEPIALAGLGYEDVESVADPITGEITYDSESLYEDLLAFIELYQNVLTSQAKYAKLQAKVDEVNKVFNELYDDLPLALQEKVDGWIGDHQGVNDGSYTDFEQYIEEGDAYIMQMRDNVIDWTPPVDLTDFIVNPRYEENNNNGWSGTTPAFQTYSNAEVFQGTFDTYQTIMLPRAGYYLLTVRAFERMGNAQNDYEIFTSGKYTENTTTSMYVTVGQLTYEHHICQLAKGAVTTDEQANYSGTWQTVGDDLHVTDNMQGAASFFFDYENNPVDWENIDETAGYYRNPLTFQLDGPSAVTIGLKKPARIIEGYDWVCWSDWKLWYLGNDASGVLVGIDEVTNSNAVAAPVQRSIYSVSGARVQNYQRGLNIVKTLDADGNVRVKKIFVK